MAKKKVVTPECVEIARLEQLFAGIDPDKRAVCRGLIVQAARLRVLLDKGYADIAEKGDTEWFSQSPDTEPYERERPVARLFNTRDKNYRSIIKQLMDMLPDKGAKNEAAEEIKGFASAARR